MENTDNKPANRRDHDHRACPELTLEDVRKIVDEARKGGVSKKTLKEFFAEGDRIAKERGIYRC